MLYSVSSCICGLFWLYHWIDSILRRMWAITSRWVDSQQALLGLMEFYMRSRLAASSLQPHVNLFILLFCCLILSWLFWLCQISKLFVTILLGNSILISFIFLFMPCDTVPKDPTIIGIIFTTFTFPLPGYFALKRIAFIYFVCLLSWLSVGQMNTQHQVYSINGTPCPSRLGLECSARELDLFGLGKPKGLCFSTTLPLSYLALSLHAQVATICNGFEDVECIPFWYRKWFHPLY